MAITVRIGKPNLTGLLKDLGVRIFKTILAIPTPDFDKMEQGADELERQMKKEREKHKKN